MAEGFVLIFCWLEGRGIQSSNSIVQPGFLSSRVEIASQKGTFLGVFHLVDQKTWLNSSPGPGPGHPCSNAEPSPDLSLKGAYEMHYY